MHVENAVGKIRLAKTWCEKLCLPAGARNKVIGIFEANLVMHIHHKISKDRPGFKSVEHICSAFIDSVVDIDKEAATKVELPFAAIPCAPAVAAAPGKKKEDNPILEFANGAITAASMERAGFKLNALISKKRIKTDAESGEKDKEELTIKSIDASEGTAIVKRGETETKISFGMLFETYDVVTHAAIIRHAANSFAPLANSTWVVEHAKAAAKICLRQSFAETTLDLYEIQKTPAPGVFVLKDIPKDGAVLSPLNHALGAEKVNVQLGVGTWKLVDVAGFNVTISKRDVWPSEEPRSMFSTKPVIPFVVPFWNVRVVQDPAEATAKVVRKEFTVDGVKISVPRIVNMKEMKKGGELTIYHGKGGTGGKGAEAGGKGAKAPEPGGQGGKGAKVGRKGAKAPEAAADADAGAAAMKGAGKGAKGEKGGMKRKAEPKHK